MIMEFLLELILYGKESFFCAQRNNPINGRFWETKMLKGGFLENVGDTPI